MKAAHTKQRQAKGGRKGKKRAAALGKAALRVPVEEGKRFVLEKILGAGGMCEVYTALDLKRVAWSDKSPRVAVKRLLPRLVDNKQARLALAQEYFTLRNLVHEGIVRAYDLHEEEWGPCYSMELLEGATLYEKQARMPAGFGKGGVDLAARIFQSLAYLHERGVVHADVKPANIFLAPDNRVVLFDFSVSRVNAKPGAACSPVAQGLRQSLNLRAHSVLHASPERLATGCPSFADDVFSACCTVYECLQGAHPFKRHTAAEAMELGLAPERPPALSLRQWNALSRGLSFEPEKRPDAAQLHKAFTGPNMITRLLDKFHII